MKKLLLFLSSLILFIFLVSCDEENPPVVPDDNPGETIIPSTTKYITSDNFNNRIVDISPDSSTYTFSSGNSTIDALQPNDVIVSDHGQGILRKVISVQTLNNNVVVSTVQGSLTDAIQQCDVTFSADITANMVGESSFIEDGVKFYKTDDSQLHWDFQDVIVYDGDNDPNTTHDLVVMNGSIDIDPSFIFQLKIRNRQLHTMDIGFIFSENADLDFTVTIQNINVNGLKTIHTFLISPITFFVGFIPVVITPSLDINVGANGNVTATITSEVNQDAQFTGGIKYENGAFTPYSSESSNFSFLQPPEFNGEANMRGFIGPRMNLMLYGIVGPYADLSLYGELNIAINPSFTAEFYAGIDVGAGIKVKILSHNLLDKYFPGIIGVNVLIWNSNNVTGNISGIVKDAVTSQPLNDVDIQVFKNSAFIASSSSNPQGTYELSVPVGDGNLVVFSKTGYLDVEYYNVSVQIFGSTILEPILQIDQSYSGSGNIDGYILDALTGYGVDGVTLRLREGINVTTGTIISSTTSSTGGYYSYNNITAGNYTIEATKSGYNTTYFSVVCLGGQTTSDQNATISPQLSSGETRIVLTWGETPYDLDSHFTGPLLDGTRFHMYYYYLGSGSPWPTIVYLDLDDVSSYGPETTTLFSQISGVYRFSVHDYTNKGSTNSSALSNSSALVRVYKQEGLVASFNIPPNNGGTLWTVFEMTGNTITPINEFSYVSSPGDVTGPVRNNIEEFEEFPIKKKNIDN